MKTVRLEGIVTLKGKPQEGVYVRLLGPSGDFVGEHRTRASGTVRFNLVPGTWTLVWMAPGGQRGERPVEIEAGRAAKVEIDLAE